jgi:hypothetical protein
VTASKSMLRGIAIGMSFVPLFVFGAAAHMYSQHVRLTGAELVGKRKILGGYEALLARAGEIDRFVFTQQTRDRSKFFLDAPSPAAMVAQLQRRLQDIIVASQARFIKAGEIPPFERDGIGYIGLRLELSGSIESLARTLTSIDSAVPLLFIERAEFGADISNDQSQTILLDLDVTSATDPSLPAEAEESKQ